MTFALYLILNVIYCKGCTTSDDDDYRQTLLDKPPGQKKERQKKGVSPKPTAPAANNPFL